MRTIVFEEPYSVTIRVEGDLDAVAAGELSNRVAKWRAMTTEKKMRLDLGDVSSIDAQAAAWLREASDRGIGLTAMSPAVRQVAASFDAGRKENLRDWLARIGIHLAPPPSAPPQSFFRRLLCAVLPPGTAGCPCAR